MWGFGWLITVIVVFGLMRFLFGWGGYYGRRGWYRRHWYGPYDDGPDGSERILRERLARGEIDEAEYERLRDLLRM